MFAFVNLAICSSVWKDKHCTDLGMARKTETKINLMTITEAKI